jgi:hypothetical protein
MMRDTCITRYPSHCITCLGRQGSKSALKPRPTLTLDTSCIIPLSKLCLRVWKRKSRVATPQSSRAVIQHSQPHQKPWQIFPVIKLKRRYPAGLAYGNLVPGLTFLSEIDSWLRYRSPPSESRSHSSYKGTIWSTHHRIAPSNVHRNWKWLPTEKLAFPYSAAETF